MPAHPRRGAPAQRAPHCRSARKSRAPRSRRRAARRPCRNRAHRRRGAPWTWSSVDSCGNSDDAHFGLQQHVIHRFDRALNVQNHGFDVAGARRTVIDDEIGVFEGHRGIADPKALQTCGLDEARRIIARRIREHRTAAPFADGLRLPALLEQHADRFVVGAGLTLEFQARSHEPFVGRTYDVPIADLVFRGPPRAPYTAPVEHVDLEHVLPGLAAKSAGIHRQRSAQSARNTREEFSGTQAPLHALAGDARAGYAGFRIDARGADALEQSERAVGVNDGAGEAAVAHQQIAAEAHPQQRYVRRQLPHERREIARVARREEQFRGTARMPRRVLRHGHVAQHARAELGRQFVEMSRAVHSRGSSKWLLSSLATAPMLPAPIVKTRSPSLSTARRASASSSTRSTNTGSTKPRLRTARQMARPSAPPIGASPAAYTSVTSSTSADASTRPKSSSRSRVRE